MVIGIPTTGTIQAETVMSLFMATPKVEMPKKLVIKTGCYVHWNRNDLVRNALESRADYLMFIDSDMVFPADAIARLVQADKDIIGATYHRRREPLEPTTKQWMNGVLQPVDMIGAVPAQVDVVATGFMLIKTSVLFALDDPWFLFATDEGTQKELGEDETFCLTAKSAGFEVWCHPDLGVGHIGQKVY